eukprot:8298795-Pyramimonas_sp.AAC.1
MPLSKTCGVARVCIRCCGAADSSSVAPAGVSPTAIPPAPMDITDAVGKAHRPTDLTCRTHCAIVRTTLSVSL